MKIKENDFMKVSIESVEKTIEEYNQSKRPLCENDCNSYTTREINGGIYKVVNMTAEEFARQNKAIGMDDIQWT